MKNHFYIMRKQYCSILDQSLLEITMSAIKTDSDFNDEFLYEHQSYESFRLINLQLSKKIKMLKKIHTLLFLFFLDARYPVYCLFGQLA